jgi:Haem-binding domain
LFSLTLLVLASLPSLPVRSDKAGLPLLADAQIDPAVLAIMQRSCRDCHSEATQYPWYAYVAPVSWLIKSDVTQGRTHLNLSRWNEYSLVQKQRSLSEIANQVKDHEMPLLEYTLLHPSARLSESDVGAIFRWTQAERSRLIAESQR